MARPIRTLLATPDPRTRQLARRVLEVETDLRIVTETGNGREALTAIRRFRPTAVFLDIELAELSGLDVAARMPHAEPPYTVLLAASADFAVKAFDVGAADYLLKPLRPADLDACLQRIRAAVRRWELCRLAVRLLELGQGDEDPGPAR